METFTQAASAILQAQKIVLSTHINPDGDALGSVLGLAHALKTLGKEVTALNVDGVPETLKWLPGAEWIETGTERRDFDLGIVVDAGALDRVGKSLLPIFEAVPLLIDIDHHVVEGSIFGQLQVLDHTAAATAELIYELILTLEVASQTTLVSPQIADCLMVGLMTDTGSFRYNNVTPKVFSLASELQEEGARVAKIAEAVYENVSFASLKLLGRALDSLERSADGQVVWASVSAQDFAEFGGTDAETEGIVSQVRAVSGAAIGILFREIPGKKVRVSIRAREGANANAIARVFEGGGHILASGCSLDVPLAEAIQSVVAEAIRQTTPLQNSRQDNPAAKMQGTDG